MRYYIIAGEASGDLHASKLIHSLSAKDAQATFRIWGGALMEKAAGVKAQRRLEDLSFMGFAEVVRHLPKILSNISFCKKDIQKWQPDVLIFIDFPGFNLRIAEWAQQKGWKTFYYIAPQVWAWKEKRVEKMKRFIDQLFVILPFEKDYFLSKGLSQVHYFGHPLTDEVKSPVAELPAPGPNARIALLPGSRKQEIEKLLPLFLRLSQSFKKFTFVIIQAPGIARSYYESFLFDFGQPEHILLTDKGAKTILPKADAALVASGTATLETALYGVPQLVAYKTSRITYEIARRLIKVEYISLVNLIVQRPLIKEWIQQDCHVENLRRELEALLFDPKRRDEIKSGYQELSHQLGAPGSTDRIASKMIELLQ